MPGTRMQRRGAAHTPFESVLAQEAEAMRGRVRRFFEEPLGRFFAEPLPPEMFAQPMGWYPAVEAAETPKEFTIKAELPGMTMQDVEVEFEDGVLTIRGEKKQERKEEEDGGRKYLLYERTYGSFQRCFTFPGSVEPDKITAEFDGGVLTVTLPKTAEAKARGKKIEVAAKK